jgi:hypothetical protein
MNAKLLQLAERRGALIATAAAQRTELTRAIAPLRSALMVLDQGGAALRFLRGHPVLLGTVVVCALVWRPGRVVGWLRNGWLVWRMVKGIKKQL